MDVKSVLRIYVFITLCDILVLSHSDSEVRTLDDGYLTFRRKRRATCEEKYATITRGHTACLQPSSALKNSGISDEEKRFVLEEHNRLRRNVYPPAKNMREMNWDDGLANLAQKWAENCRIGHDPKYKRYDYGRFDVGQNLCWATYKMSWEEALGLWSNETKLYQYGRSSGIAKVAHYTQIIWAETSLVGCGYAHCEGLHLYVCDYGPAGNINDMSKPYESGQTCGDCPYTCRDKLCDCRGQVCFNGGKMDLNTCTCTCNKEFNFYVKPYCHLNCTNIKDPDYCVRQFGAKACEMYSNVPQMCPDMCNWCPAAGKKQETPVHATKQINAERRYEYTRTGAHHRDSRRRHEPTVVGSQDQYSRRRNEHTPVATQRPDADRTYKESDLHRVATIVQKNLAVKMEPMVHTYVEQALEKEVQDLENKNKVLKKKVNSLNNKVTKQDNELDSIEQDNRHNTLRIVGIPEERSEDTDRVVMEVASAVDRNIKLSDIDRSQRVGKIKRDRSRDIIVKFVSYRARERLYEARKRLKETEKFSSVSINEYLTRKRKKLFLQARKLVKSRILNKAWSSDGTIYIEDLKDKRRKISKDSDLEKYMRRITTMQRKSNQTVINNST